MRMPQTKTGRLTLKLVGVFIILMVTAQSLDFVWRATGADFIRNVLFPAVMVLAGLSVLSAFVASLVSIFRHKERSWPVFIAFLIGLGVVFMLLGEFLFPH